MERDKDLKVDVNALDDDTRCEYCIYHYDCQKNIEYHAGEMFEPYCTNHEPDDWFDTEEYLKNLEESEEDPN